MVLISASAGCRVSSRVCCTTTGIVEVMMLEKSVPFGTGSRSVKSLKRRCSVRRAPQVNL